MRQEDGQQWHPRQSAENRVRESLSRSQRETEKPVSEETRFCDEHIESESTQKDYQSLEWTSHRWRGWGFFTNSYKSLNTKKKQFTSGQPVLQVVRFRVSQQNWAVQEEEKLGPEERPHMVTGDWEFSLVFSGKNKNQKNPELNTRILLCCTG